MSGGVIMATMQKPGFLYLPGDLGEKVFKEILSSEKVDREEMNKRARALEQEILAKEYAEKK